MTASSRKSPRGFRGFQRWCDVLRWLAATSLTSLALIRIVLNWSWAVASLAACQRRPGAATICGGYSYHRGQSSDAACLNGEGHKPKRDPANCRRRGLEAL